MSATSIPPPGSSPDCGASPSIRTRILRRLWTPDSTSVALGSNRSGTFKLYRQSITQSVPDLLVDTEDTLQARAAPDGEHLIYMVGGNPDNLERKVSVMSVPVQGARRASCSVKAASLISSVLAPLLSLYSTQRLMPNAPAYAKVFSFAPERRNPSRVPAASYIRFPGMESLAGWFHARHDREWSEASVRKYGGQVCTRNQAHRELDPTHRHRLGGGWKIRVHPESQTGRQLRGAASDARRDPRRSGGGKTPRYQWAVPAPDGQHVAVQGVAGEGNVWLLENY